MLEGSFCNGSPTNVININLRKMLGRIVFNSRKITCKDLPRNFCYSNQEDPSTSFLNIGRITAFSYPVYIFLLSLINYFLSVEKSFSFRYI